MAKAHLPSGPLSTGEIPGWLVAVLRIGLFGILVFFWWLASIYVARSLVPSPLETYAVAQRLYMDWRWQQAIQASMTTYGSGFFLATAVAIPLGMMMGAFNLLGQTLELYVYALSATPRVAVIGPSGCGKTTLLRMANGIIRPDSGSVLRSGSPPRPGSGAGFVFQSFQLLPWATVLGNIELARGALPLSRKKRRECTLHSISLVGLSRFAESHPKQLSGGMCKRVARARALAVEPQILLMDEPFVSLEAQTRELMQLELMAVWKRHRAMVLFVTHSVDEAILLADKIVLMGKGQVLESLDVGLERRPRYSEKLHADARFSELREYLWVRIRDLVISDPNSDFFGREHQLAKS